MDFQDKLTLPRSRSLHVQVMSTSPSGKRKLKSSLLQRPSFGPLSKIHDDPQRPVTPTSKTKRTLFTTALQTRSSDASGSVVVDSESTLLPPDSPKDSRSSLLRRGRPSSLLGSLKSFRVQDDDTPPGTATSSQAPSLNWSHLGTQFESSDIGRNKTVLHHGEAQTNTGIFWKKKKEYLVLTETHLIRFKNQAKASETFPSIPPFPGRTGMIRHTSSPSNGTKSDSPSISSDTSGERAAGLPLEQIVAVYLSDDPRHSPTLDISYLDSEAGQGSTLVLQFQDPDDLITWMRSIRLTADRARLLNIDPIPPKLSEYAARVVEREQDYDITNYRIYKVVKRRLHKSGGRSSSDDFSKITATVCFLAVGIRCVHIIVLPKNPLRVSSPSLSDLNEGGSFGVLTMSGIVLSDSDDGFTLTFRLPFQKPRVFQLASLASSEIAQRLRQIETRLRPGWNQRPFVWRVPRKVEEEYYPDEEGQTDNLDPFDRTLIAYCVAYGVNPSIIRYAIRDTVEDSPRFELLEPAHSDAKGYSGLELLAIIRSLRYNESFGSIAFAGISLDVLNSSFDRYGTEHICTNSLHGLPVRLAIEEQREAPLLVQEIRALAIASRKLRRLDFSFCISSAVSKHASEGGFITGGCGIIEALFPLFKQQATNVDWIALNGIELQETDLDYLVSIAADKASHFRAIEASKCGLTDRGMALLLDVFRAHDSTLEALDLSNNPLRLVPSILSRQLGVFTYMRRLDLSNLAVTSSSDPLLPIEILSVWRLDDLRLRGIALNEPTVSAICKYLSLPHSSVLRELILSNCSLTGADAARIMSSMTQDPEMTRFLHLDISENKLEEVIEKLASAIAKDLAPTHLTIKSIEYDHEESFENLLLAFAGNKSVRYLDLAKTSLPGEAGEEVCKALERLLAENQTLEDLDISGEDSRLEVSKLGDGIHEALKGLKMNKSLQILRVQYQRLGLQGASTLADVLKENKTLRQLHCDHNAITLSGFTDLINALTTNTTLLYLPRLFEGRDAALRQTEEQIKLARTRADGTMMSTTNSKMGSMRRTFASFSTGGVGLSKGSEVNSGGRVAALPQWTEQDVQAALRLVNEGWEGQANRLEAYLERNWRIWQGLAIDQEAEAAANKEDRPGTAGSISKALERAMMETTPTLEKQLQLGHGQEADYTQEVERPASIDSRGSHSFEVDSTLIRQTTFKLAEPPPSKNMEVDHRREDSGLGTSSVVDGA